MTLSWLVRGQVGAKRGKLTLLGGLRGTKLELKEALGGAQEAPREPERATAPFDISAGGLIFGPAGRPN